MIRTPILIDTYDEPRADSATQLDAHNAELLPRCPRRQRDAVSDPTSRRGTPLWIHQDESRQTDRAARCRAPESALTTTHHRHTQRLCSRLIRTNG